jgi:hypothetical protein
MLHLAAASRALTLSTGRSQAAAGWNWCARPCFEQQQHQAAIESLKAVRVCMSSRRSRCLLMPASCGACCGAWSAAVALVTLGSSNSVSVLSCC